MEPNFEKGEKQRNLLKNRKICLHWACSINGRRCSCCCCTITVFFKIKSSFVRLSHFFFYFLLCLVSLDNEESTIPLHCTHKGIHFLCLSLFFFLSRKVIVKTNVQTYFHLESLRAKTPTSFPFEKKNDNFVFNFLRFWNSMKRSNAFLYFPMRLMLLPLLLSPAQSSFKELLEVLNFNLGLTRTTV